jgi:hypothetical protein
VRGGTALTGSADIIVEVERPSESAGLAKAARVLKIVSRFANGPDEIAVELGEDDWRSLGTVDAAVKRSRREEILALLTGDPCTLDQILLAGGLTGRKGRTVRRRLDELAELGLAAVEGSGARGDPRRWKLSENGRIFRDTFVTGVFGGSAGVPRNPFIEAKNSRSDSGQQHPGSKGPVSCPESLWCPLHPGEHKVAKRAAGLVYLACGCHQTDPLRSDLSDGD